MWPSLVAAGHTHPVDGFPSEFQRASSTPYTRAVIGISRRAACVLPLSTRIVPRFPFGQHICSHRILWLMLKGDAPQPVVRNSAPLNALEASR